MDAALLQKMFYAGAKRLESQKEIINELNVFPVPDGDTGTNMTLTILSAVREVGQVAELTMNSLAKAMSSGSLKGARGNSGVILSQLMRGFSKVIRDYDELTVPVLADAFAKGVETAYNAVMKPKEGTILTVAKAGALRAGELADELENLEEFLAAVIERMQEALDYTPELLPVLKEAGVVDSGGQGLLEIMHGAYDALIGKETGESIVTAIEAPQEKRKGAASPDISTADIKFGYCTEFIILLEKEFPPETETAFKAYLASIGDSIVCVADDDVVKVHVHTNDPGLAIQKGLTFGQLSRMKIDNMREEHNERLIMGAEAEKKEQKAAAPAPRKPVGFIAVSVGSGMDEIFTGLGVDVIISGGQTMNPSTEDMLNAIEAVNADCIYILPNNSNIILAAQQAKSLTKDKQIIVIPSKTAPQGIAAIINYVFDKDAEENEKAMTAALANVKSGQVTYAVRDTSYEGREIHEGNIMGIGDSGILSVGESIADTTYDMLRKMIDEDSELVSLYYGEDVGEEDAQQLADRIMEEYPMLDVEVHSGGQPIYYYILSVE